MCQPLVMGGSSTLPTMLRSLSLLCIILWLFGLTIEVTVSGFIHVLPAMAVVGLIVYAFGSSGWQVEP